MFWRHSFVSLTSSQVRQERNDELLALNLVKRPETAVRVFLTGDGVTFAKKGQKTPDGFYNVERMLKSLARRGEVAL
jgi:sulfur relay (sulfurtransferase) complex TusBCD TusD component (DsrE family)